MQLIHSKEKQILHKDIFKYIKKTKNKTKQHHLTHIIMLFTDTTNPASLHHIHIQIHICQALQAEGVTIGMPAPSNKSIQKTSHFKLTKPCAKNSNRRLLVSNCISAGKTTDDWQITDCNFPSISQSNKWAKRTLSSAYGGEWKEGIVTDIDVSTIQASWMHSAFSTQRSAGSEGLHVDH